MTMTAAADWDVAGPYGTDAELALACAAGDRAVVQTPTQAPPPEPPPVVDEPAIPDPPVSPRNRHRRLPPPPGGGTLTGPSNLVIDPPRGKLPAL